jgi:hypothetical protein
LGDKLRSEPIRYAVKEGVNIEHVEAAMKFALVVTRESQVEEAVVANLALGGARHNPNVIDKKVADGDHLVPQFKNFPDAQILPGFFDCEKVESPYLLLQPTHLLLEHRALASLIQKRGVRLSAFGFQQIQCGWHGPISTPTWSCVNSGPEQISSRVGVESFAATEVTKRCQTEERDFRNPPPDFHLPSRIAFSFVKPIAPRSGAGKLRPFFNANRSANPRPTLGQ